MKKGYWKGFLTGTLMGVLILGLGITAIDGWLPLKD